MYITRSHIPLKSHRIPLRLKIILTRCGSLILLFQRMPLIKMLFPEANILGGAALANSASIAITTVVGLGVFDSVAGQTTIDEVLPIAKAGKDPASTSSTNAVNVPAAVSAPLNFEFKCTTAPSRPKSWQITGGTTLPAGLVMSYTTTTPTGAYNNFVTGTPSSPGTYPVNITVYRNTSYGGENVTQRFNICVLGFSTQPAASTTIDSGQTTTLTCVATGVPVATSWHNTSATLTYEWYEGTSGTLGPILGTSASFTTPALTATTNYWVRIKSVLGTSTVYANSVTAAVTVQASLSPFEAWAAGAGLPAGKNGPMDTPQGDGVTNLEKFAFNLDPSAPSSRHLTAGAGGSEDAGLPCSSLSGSKLRIEYLRRVASSNPGITYIPQFSTNFGTWSEFTGTPVSVTPVTGSPDWERVVVEDPTGGSSRFGRVGISLAP